MRRSLATATLIALAACGSKGSSRGSPSPPRTCAIAVRESVLPSELVQDLGTLQVGTSASFAVPPGTGSFVIFSQEVGNSAPASVIVQEGGQRFAVPNAVVPTDVKAPDQTVYYDDLAPWDTVTIGSFTYPDVSGLLAYSVGFQAVSSGFPVPNTSAGLAATGGQIQTGSWTFTVNDWARQCPFGPACVGASDASGRYRVHVVTRPALDPSGIGTLDVEVYLATDPSSALPDAAAAAVHPKIVRWKQSLAHFLAKGGVALGAVRFHDLAQDVKDRYAPNGAVDVTDQSPCGDLQQLFTNATVASRGVHVFLADEILASDGQGPFRTVGVDGSIPGPSGFPGTINGGAIVAVTNLEFEAGGGCGSATPDLTNCGADTVAYIAAHEIGHWLGLFHTTEMRGTLFDPLDTTARCPCAVCAAQAQQGACAEVQGSSGTTLVTNDRCVASADCGGGDNLMFWALDDGSPAAPGRDAVPARSTGALTPEQGQIMRLNPAVR